MGLWAKNPAISLKRCNKGPRLLWRTNRKSHTCFRFEPKSMILDDLERPKRTLAEKSNEDRPILSAAKCRSMILVSRNIRCMRIFAGFLGSGYQMTVGLSTTTFLANCFVKIRAAQHYYVAISNPLSACNWLPNEWPRMTMNDYFVSNSVFERAVLLKAFNFQSPPQKTNEDRRTQSATIMKANECNF